MACPLEICVDAPDDLAAAIAGGADRIELCSALALGGLTPTPGLIRAAQSCPVPVYAMIRPRGGDFRFSRAEAQQMEAEIAAVRAAGLAGVVLGAADAAGGLDLPLLRRLIQVADGLGTTLHRVVDTLSDPVAAVRPAMDLGFERILTSGGADKAQAGAGVLSRMIGLAGSRIEVMAGSGVAAENVPALAAAGVRSFHASCSVTDPDTGTRRIDVAALRALRDAVNRVS